MKKSKCKFCSTLKKRDEGKVINNSFFCDFDCAVKYAKSLRLSKDKLKEIKPLKVYIKVAKKAKKAPSKRELNKLNSNYQLNLTKKAIQRWVNHVRDAGKPCISCNTTNDVIYCGGHYKTAGGHPETALNSLNIFKQCNFHCNSQLSGNLNGNKKSKGMIQGILDNYGQNRLDYLNSPKAWANYTIEEMIELRAYYNYLIRNNIKDDARRAY